MGEVFIVIPAYNESSSIGKVIGQIKKQGYERIVIVDDGSKDNTAKTAEKRGAVVLKHLINRGQGAALKTGIDYALKQGAEVIVTFDADGQFLAKEIKKLVNSLDRKTHVVLGSRFLGNAQNIPFMKKLILKIGIIVVRILYGIRVTDSQNGFRALTREAAEKIEISSNRMEHAGEIMHEIVKNNLSYKEVPVTVVYSDYAVKKGQSWTHSIKLGIKMVFNKFMR